MTSLAILDLSRNNLRVVKNTWFKDTVSLIALALNNNNIDCIEESAFSNLRKLEHLDLGSNHLKRIKAEWFRNTVSLHSLTLQNNGIEYIEKCAFCKITDLLSLDLNNNKLTHVMADLFGDTMIPNYFHLRDNKIRYIEKELIDKTKNVEGLEISGNYLDCSSIEGIILGMKNSSRIDFRSNLCSDERRLFGLMKKKNIDSHVRRMRAERIDFYCESVLEPIFLS